MHFFSPLGEVNTSNIPLSSPLLHPPSTSEKETSDLTSSFAGSRGSLDLACEDPRSKDSKRESVPNRQTPALPESRSNGASRVSPQRISLISEIQRNPKAHPKTKLAATKKLCNKALESPASTESPAN